VIDAERFRVVDENGVVRAAMYAEGIAFFDVAPRTWFGVRRGNKQLQRLPVRGYGRMLSVLRSDTLIDGTFLH